MEPIDSKAVLNKRENLRISAANAPISKPIERRLLEITKQANLRTRDKFPEPTDADCKFREYIDKQVS